MPIYDTFDNYKYKIKVECYNSLGGPTTFHLLNKVPDVKIDNDFDAVAYYGSNYNIFDYEKSKKVIAIRDGIFLSIDSLEEMSNVDTCGYLCIDTKGYQIETVDTVADYKLLLFNHEKSIEQRRDSLNKFKLKLSEELTAKKASKSSRINIIRKLKELFN